MKTFKNLFFLSILFAIFSVSFVAETQAQNRKDGKFAIVFNAKDMNLWKAAPIPARLRDGKVLLATFNRDGTQIFAKVRQGKVVQVGQQSRGGSFKALRPQQSPYCVLPDCGYAYSYVKCYIYEKDNLFHCFCLCMGDFTTGN